jgi:hypothetical protein
MPVAKIAVTVAEIAVSVAASLAFDKYVTKPVINKAFTPIKARIVKA